MQDHGLRNGLDITLIPRCAPALPFGNAKPVPVYIEAEAINTQRAIGTTLSHEVHPTLANNSARIALQRPVSCIHNSKGALLTVNRLGIWASNC